ncbi:putative retrotransposon hot spot (RHS) protein [Trypanosoma cruzi]|uniref:Putative retrotransposon hot spot (RHS) protein n=1 Tax=Trypanosoma cruzi TaxID=5693 RepID=A0A2V2UXX0_TRYCR|nr:putative retrotransposon hot spot (RHS) protein [Trypanosoma cruzi]
MSGRPETVHGGNGEGPASTVPQGNGRRMARPVLEGGTDQLAATRRRMEEARQPQWTLDSRVEDVLLEATARSTNMKLNDFLWQNLGGRGVVDTNRSVLLKELLKDPTRYIRDAGVLNEIHASSHYKRIRNDLRNKMFFDEDVRKLEENGVNTLIGWLEAAAEVKEIVHGITKQFLNAFLEDVRNSMRMSAPRYLEGCYESVYNARWHHVVEVPGGEGTGLEVREGESPQPWTYKAVGRTLEKDDGVEQSGAARPRLMVLTSDKAWPYSWNRKEDKSTRDCYVNCEVERVWQIVKDDLTEFFGTHGGTEFTPKRRLLIGTPGIGKSMAAGSYLLYQLLHYDAEQIQMVVYLIADRTFLFDKTSRTVSTYMGDSDNASFVRSLSDCGMKGYIIYNVAEPDDEPSDDLPPRGWGMVWCHPHSRGTNKEWVKRRGATQ